MGRASRREHNPWINGGRCCDGRCGQHHEAPSPTQLGWWPSPHPSPLTNHNHIIVCGVCVSHFGILRSNHPQVPSMKWWNEKLVGGATSEVCLRIEQKNRDVHAHVCPAWANPWFLFWPCAMYRMVQETVVLSLPLHSSSMSSSSSTQSCRLQVLYFDGGVYYNKQKKLATWHDQLQKVRIVRYRKMNTRT